MALGKNGRRRFICFDVFQNGLLIPITSASLDRIAALLSMDPNARNRLVDPSLCLKASGLEAGREKMPLDKNAHGVADRARS
jgi:hypothetical protein